MIINRLKVSNNPMQNGEIPNYISTTLQDGKVNEVAQTYEVRSSTRVKTQLVKLNDYERLFDQVIGENGGLIEEVFTTKCEQINLNQALKYEKCQAQGN